VYSCSATRSPIFCSGSGTQATGRYTGNSLGTKSMRSGTSSTWRCVRLCQVRTFSTMVLKSTCTVWEFLPLRLLLWPTVIGTCKQLCVAEVPSTQGYTCSVGISFPTAATPPVLGTHDIRLHGTMCPTNDLSLATYTSSVPSTSRIISIVSRITVSGIMPRITSRTAP